MQFYVSWYPGDPWYPSYDSECNMLISITSVSLDWALEKASPLPCRLMLDSGGYRYALLGKSLTPKEVFQRQLHIIGESRIPTILCALDFPILQPDHLSPNEQDQFISQTLAYAWEFKLLIEKHGLPECIEGMPVIQGWDIPSLVYCAYEFKNMGFTRFGVGSLAFLRSPQEIVERVKAVIEVVGPNLHVFGISSLRTLQALHALGINSVDSSRPAKSAMYNQVFYSKPFRCFVIPGSQDRLTEKSSEYQQTQILPCNCPVCGGKTNPEIFRLGRREYVWQRTLHNYWHMKRAICEEIGASRQLNQL